MAAHSRLLPLPFLVLAACAELGATPPAGDEEPGYAGPTRFEITSRYDGVGALPPAVRDALELMRGFDEDPGAAVLALLESADLPWLDQILGLFGDELADWVNDYLADKQHNGAPVAAEIASWARDIENLLSTFEIRSDFSLGSFDAAGGTISEHRLAGVAFELRGESRLIDTPELVNQFVVARDVSCHVAQGQDAERLTLDIGDHGFHMPLGDFALPAFNWMLSSYVGQPDLAGALESLIDCDRLAAELATRCSFCADYEEAFEEVCATGIELVAAEIEQQIASIEYAELRLSAGTGALIGGRDSSGAKVLERIEDGSWQAELQIDGLTLATEARFSGRRAD